MTKRDEMRWQKFPFVGDSIDFIKYKTYLRIKKNELKIRCQSSRLIESRWTCCTLFLT